MPSPFPGMDPYLEHPWIWPDVHSALMVAIRDDIAAQVSPRYYVALESRIYLNEPGEPDAFRIPDVSVLSASENGDGRGGGVMGMYDTSGGTAVAVEIPIPEEVRETYLEIRDSEHHYMITAVECCRLLTSGPAGGARYTKRSVWNCWEHGQILWRLTCLERANPWLSEPMGYYAAIIVS